MLALQQSSEGVTKAAANILPCRIQYDGPTKVTKRYWSPQVEKGGHEYRVLDLYEQG
jgi:hypothetical protein